MRGKPVILVVDDDAPILILMRSVLREFGFEARTASNGQAALAEAAQTSPDLILLDKNMPGMTMREIIDALRGHPLLSGVPILILSGDPMAPDEIAALGAAGAVQKPFDLARLVDQIRTHVGPGSSQL
ncbi:MAG: response regulator [Thermoanaerobaculia bacterium]|nr:response regulator [Thermoanaerobaculia bacterium]